MLVQFISAQQRMNNKTNPTQGHRNSYTIFNLNATNFSNADHIQKAATKFFRQNNLVSYPSINEFCDKNTSLQLPINGNTCQ